MIITIPTENIGSIPRPAELIMSYERFNKGELTLTELDEMAKAAILDTLKRLEETGSSVITDGEQHKFSGFASYCLHGASNVAQDGVEILFSDGHSRFLPRLLEGPFRFQRTADEFLSFAKAHTLLPVKQAVISPSLLSLIYPVNGINGYSRVKFIEDLIEQHTQEVRRCLELGAHIVQIDFTEARLSLKLDPSGELLEDMVDLINKALAGFSDEERQRIGVHTCPGSDKDSTHSADVDYKDLLPTLFQINVGNFYIAMAGEREPEKALRLIKTILRPGIRVFIGVINPIDPNIESAELVRDRVLQAAQFIPVEQLGICDDCGFAPFADDISTARDLAFAKIKSRIDGVKLAEKILSSQNP